MKADTGKHLISIHALLAESDRRASRQQPAGEISIHALLAESDYLGAGKSCDVCGISIHALLAESDSVTSSAGTMGKSFLSTLSLRRATDISSRQMYHITYFYPRSPCGERHSRQSRRQLHLNFYPRSPCGERHCRHAQRPTQPNFYPRSPCGERRSAWVQEFPELYISIHALLAESDREREPALSQSSANFYPRSPCGERPSSVNVSASGSTFLSTLSLRRATADISTRREASKYFYPRSPCGERPYNLMIYQPKKDFYPRSPCGERPWLDAEY